MSNGLASVSAIVARADDAWHVSAEEGVFQPNLLGP